MPATSPNALLRFDGEPVLRWHRPVPAEGATAPEPAAVSTEETLQSLWERLTEGNARLLAVHRRLLEQPAHPDITPADPGLPPEPGLLPSAAIRSRPSGVVWDASDLQQFATGSVAAVFGKEFAVVDGYSRRVRLPAEPYHFVSRVTDVQAQTGVFERSSITTEYDVPIGAWYTVDGQVPPAVTVEAGQCDLLLASYLGIDFRNRGERVYRLLDSTLTFSGDLPQEGQTLRYEITIQRFVDTPGPTLFFFGYRCFADDELIVELSDACAGFFTDDELAASGGIVQGRLELDPRAHQQRSFKALVPTPRATLGEADLTLLSRGRIAEVFGPSHDQRGANPSLRLGPDALRMVDRVTELSVTGGRHGLGRMEAVKELVPDSWYFTSHFTDDPVLPGSLVAEGGVQLLQTFALASGLHLVLPDARFQPVPGLQTSVKVRGQILPSCRRLRYVVELREVTLLPRPTVIADVVVHLEGPEPGEEKAVIRIDGLGIRLVEKPGTPYAAGPGGVVAVPLGRYNAQGEPAMLNELHMEHAARGDLAVAMGPEFAVYAGRRAPYIPNGDFKFVDRVMRLQGTRGDLCPGSVMETEYDVPTDAWFFGDNGAPVMPNCVYMETSLQAAILLGYYLGATLAFPDASLRIRNLDGKAQVVRHVDLRGRTIRHRSTLLSSIPMLGAVLQRFRYELSCDGEVFYTGESLFGYFSDEALSAQVGLDAGKHVESWMTTSGSAPLARTVDYPALRSLQATRSPRLPSGKLELVSGIRVIDGGGRHGLGYLHGTRTITPADWYFDCHFHTDPVMPGSLGVEAILTALQAWVVDQGLAAGIENPVFDVARGVELSWRYRGQLPREEAEMSFEAHVSEVRREADRLVVIVDASLWKPGLRIYELTDLALEVRPDKEARR